MFVKKALAIFILFTFFSCGAEQKAASSKEIKRVLKNVDNKLSFPKIKLENNTVNKVKPTEENCKYKIQSLSKLKSGILNEVSGLIRHSKEPGYFFVHNDSGDKAQFYLINIKGELIATYKFKKHFAVDMEDITALPCPGDEKQSCLALADFGDNSRIRKQKNIIIFKEPQKPFKNAQIEYVKKLSIEYSFKPVDCEAVFYSSKLGKIIAVTKAYKIGDGRVFLIDPSQEKQRVTSYFDFPPKPLGLKDTVVTAAASYKDQLIALRYYNDIKIFKWDPKFSGFIFQYKIIHIEAQGESIEFSKDGKELYTISEGRGAYINKITLPLSDSCKKLKKTK